MNQELLKKLQNLPIETPRESDFYSWLSELLWDFQRLVGSNEQAANDNPVFISWHRNDTLIVGNLVTAVLESIDFFLKGKHGLAYQSLSKGINSDPSIKEYLKYQTKLNGGTSYYRARIVDDNKLRPRSEFFHIPFSLRHIVDNQRFSIQGYPCLYLGTSVYVCWLEMGCPPLEKFQVCRLKANDDLSIYNYSMYDFKKGYETSFFDVLGFIRIWPLIAASMIKVRNRDARFKQEYIIPQLLMQFAMESDEWDGLMYSSTHATPEANADGSNLQNIVFPAWCEPGDVSPQTGLSTLLARKFTISDPISWPILQMSRGYDNRLYDREAHTEFNKRMPSFNLLPGGSNSYHHSVFGQMEEYLDGLDTYPVIPD